MFSWQFLLPQFTSQESPSFSVNTTSTQYLSTSASDLSMEWLLSRSRVDLSDVHANQIEVPKISLDTETADWSLDLRRSARTRLLVWFTPRWAHASRAARVHFSAAGHIAVVHVGFEWNFELFSRLYGSKPGRWAEERRLMRFQWFVCHRLPVESGFFDA